MIVNILLDNVDGRIELNRLNMIYSHNDFENVK